MVDDTGEIAALQRENVRLKTQLEAIRTILLDTAAVDTVEPRFQIASDGITAFGQFEAGGIRFFKTDNCNWVVKSDSTAALEISPACVDQQPWIIPIREQLIADGTWVREGDHYRFTRDAVFTSNTVAYMAVTGEPGNGGEAWCDTKFHIHLTTWRNPSALTSVREADMARLEVEGTTHEFVLMRARYCKHAVK